MALFQLFYDIKKIHKRLWQKISSFFFYIESWNWIISIYYMFYWRTDGEADGYHILSDTKKKLVFST